MNTNQNTNQNAHPSLETLYPITTKYFKSVQSFKKFFSDYVDINIIKLSVCGDNYILRKDGYTLIHLPFDVEKIYIKEKRVIAFGFITDLEND
jgi:hypothetical protein